MPCIEVKGGYQIRRSKGGLYPKVYKSKSECEIRVREMETFKHMDASQKKAAFGRAQ